MTEPDLVARIKELLDLERYKEALQKAEQGLTRDPDSATLHAQRARAYLGLGEAYRAAEAARYAIRNDPQWSYPYNLLAYALRAGHDPGGAERALTEAIRLDPEAPESYLGLARLRLDRSDAAGALRSVEQALARDSEYLPAIRFRAKILVRLGRSEAEEATQRLMRENPGEAESQLVHAAQLLSLGRTQEAEERFLEALRLDPSDDEARLGAMEAMREQFLPYRLACQASRSFMRLGRWVWWVVGLVAFGCYGVLIAFPSLGPYFASALALCFGRACTFPLATLNLWRRPQGRLVMTPDVRRHQFLFAALLGLAVAFGVALPWFPKLAIPLSACLILWAVLGFCAMQGERDSRGPAWFWTAATLGIFVLVSTIEFAFRPPEAPKQSPPANPARTVQVGKSDV